MVDLDELLRMANEDAPRALALSEDWLQQKPGALERSSLHRAQAIAYRTMGEHTSALASCDAAHAAATAAGDRRLIALAMMTKAPLMAMSGDLASAFELLNTSEPELHGLDRALALLQRGGLRGLTADYVVAQADFAEALNVLHATERRDLIAGALLGHGVVRAFLGEVVSGTEDLRNAAAIFDELGDRRGRAEASHNLAVVALIAGDPARAVVEFTEATRLWKAANAPVEQLLADHCEALLEAGLYERAAALADTGVQALEETGNHLEEATQRLVLARALHRVGEDTRARHELEWARSSFEIRGQDIQADSAELVSLRFELRLAFDGKQLARRAMDVARRVRKSKNVELIAEAELVLSLVQVAIGEVSGARRRLLRLRPARCSFAQQLERIEVLATIAYQRGERGVAVRLSRRAVNQVEAANQLGGSSMLRGAMSRHLEAVVSMGVDGLCSAGRPREALLLLERAQPHIGGARTNFASPKFVERRALDRALTRGLPPEEKVAVTRRRDAVDHEIRSEYSQLVEEATTAVPVLSANTAVRRFVRAGDHVWALDLVRNRVRSTTLGELRTISSTLAELFYFLRRDLAVGTGASAELHDVARELDLCLGRPGDVGPAIETLHIVPTLAMSSIPFGLLPSMKGRQWLQVQRSTSGGQDRRSATTRFVVAGSGLRHAHEEVSEIGQVYGERVKPGRDEARCDQVLQQMSGKGLVHIAAHSNVNPDNLMFSSIKFSDGDLYLHQLEGITCPPSVVVLASCESARTGRVGMKPVGLGAGLLAAGIDTVIGTACAIPDSTSTVSVMTSLHVAEVQESPARAVSAVANAVDLSPAQRLIAQCLVPMREHPVSVG